MSTEKETIGDRLRAERMRLKLTQLQVSEVAGITVQTQRKYESAKRYPDASYLESIASIGFDVNYIIVGKKLVDIVEDAKKPRTLDLKACFDNVLDAINELGVNDKLNSDQLKTLLDYAYTHQVSHEDLKDFIKTVLAFAEQEMQ